MAEFCHMDYRMKGIQLNTGLNIGGDSPIRINCNIGCNTLSGYNQEKEKLLTLREEGVLPDMMMDLSLIELNCTPKVLRLTFGVQFKLAQPHSLFKKSAKSA